jgi:hypothetical protein
MRERARWILVSALLLTASPSDALPVFARRYGETCQKCHSIAPRLNAFGLAFQANHYNWPGGKPPAAKSRQKSGLAALPISGLATFSVEDSRTDRKTTADFRTLELFAANGFGLSQRRRGG